MSAPMKDETTQERCPTCGSEDRRSFKRPDYAPCINDAFHTDAQASAQVRGLSGHYVEHLSTHVRTPEECPTCIAYRTWSTSEHCFRSGGAREWLTSQGWLNQYLSKDGWKNKHRLADMLDAYAESRVSALREKLRRTYAEGRLYQFNRMKQERPADPCYWDMHEENGIKADISPLAKPEVEKEK